MSESNKKPSILPLRAQFLTSAARLDQCPETQGIEIAFAGRSNSGKSSAINCLCQHKSLAKTSKTPGRTQLLNFFSLANSIHCLVDLPGYGYAKVSGQQKQNWGKHIQDYLTKREALQALVLVMDIRHPMRDFDQQMVEWGLHYGKPMLLLLSKADKLSKNQQQKQLKLVNQSIPKDQPIKAIPFSSSHGVGVDDARKHIYHWLGMDTE